MRASSVWCCLSAFLFASTATAQTQPPISAPWNVTTTPQLPPPPPTPDNTLVFEPLRVQVPMALRPLTPIEEDALRVRRADEWRGARIGLGFWAALGGSLAGAMVGAIPGSLILLASPTTSSPGFWIGTVLGNTGGFAGLLFGAAWCTMRAGSNYYGQGGMWFPMLGYGIGGVVGGGILLAGFLSNNIPTLIVGALGIAFLPPAGAVAMYEFDSERTLAPMRERAMGLRASRSPRPSMSIGPGSFAFVW